MGQKEAYKQLECEVIAFTSDIVRTSNGEGNHLIPDVEDWGDFIEDNDF